MTALLSIDSKNFTVAPADRHQVADVAVVTLTGNAHRLSITVRLVGPAQQVRDALWLLNLDQRFPTFPTLPEALCDGQAVGAVLRSVGVPRPDQVEAL